jgi:mannitol/fructose-specific phosphotransferase system IIA component (Ntr-type)
MPVRIIVMIIAGRDQHAQYSKVLSQISRLLKDESFRSQLLNTSDPNKVFKLFTTGAAL